MTGRDKNAAQPQHQSTISANQPIASITATNNAGISPSNTPNDAGNMQSIASSAANAIALPIDGSQILPQSPLPAIQQNPIVAATVAAISAAFNDDGHPNNYNVIGGSNGFQPIIADIMRGFGDCEQPRDDTVALVERILLQQLRAILHDVMAVSVQRKGRNEPTRTDFEYLMRRNPTKVLRLQQHIRDLMLKRKWEELQKSSLSATGGRTATAAVQSILMQPVEDELDTNGAHSDTEEADREVTVARYDEEKVRRIFRADRISQQLNGAAYLRYNEARRSSFCCKNSPRLRDKLRRWLDFEFPLSNQVLTILGYLAHETIAVLVDYAILTRLHSGNRSNDPFERVVSSSKFI